MCRSCVTIFLNSLPEQLAVNLRQSEDNNSSPEFTGGPRAGTPPDDTTQPKGDGKHLELNNPS